MKKRVLALVVSLAMVLSAMTPVYANAPETWQDETAAGSVVETVDISTGSTDAAEEAGGEDTFTGSSEDGPDTADTSDGSEVSGTSGTSETSETSDGSGTDGNSNDVSTGDTSDTSSVSGSSTGDETSDGSPEEAGEASGTSEVSETSEPSGEAIVPEADLGLDGSQVRLFVGTGDPSILDQDHILSGYNGLYILAYGSAQEAAVAYSSLAGRVSFVAYDKAVVTVADIEDVSGQVQTTDTNAVAELSSTPSVYGNGMIALIDTGASGGNVVTAVSMLGDDPSDDNGHGTRMAELIAAQNPGAQIISIKAFDSSGHASPSTLYTAIRYAIDADVSVINLSVSGFATANTAPIAEILNEAISRGITVIGAAGNDGMDAAYTIPGGLGGAVIAGSASEGGARAGFSNYGDTVDWYVLSGSTSEAAAILSGIYTRDGFIAADNATVFTPGYDPLKDGDQEWSQLSSGEIDARFGISRDGFDVADTVDVTVSGYGSDAYFYGGYSPWLNAGGNMGYCLISYYPVPGGQSLTFNRTTVDSTSEARLQLMAKALYYGYGGGGDVTAGYVGANADLQQGLTHFALAYIAYTYFGIGTAYPWYCSSVSNNYNVDATGQGIVMNFVNSLDSRPAVSGTLYYSSVAFTSGVQDVAFGNFNITAEISLTKVSTESDTADLSGAVFGVYNTEANASAARAALALTGNEVGVFETDADGTGLVQSTSYTSSSDNKKLTGLPGGMYWVVELTAPGGFLGAGTVYWLNTESATSAIGPADGLDDDTRAKMIAASSVVQTGNSVVITAADAPGMGYLKIVKTSADTSLTDGNSCYSLENAQFAVFSNQTSANTAAANPTGYASLAGYEGELTTNASGETGTIQLNTGTYYAAEVTAPKGYARSTEVKTVTVAYTDTESSPASVTFTDIPLSDPIAVLLRKIDSKTGESVPQGNGSLAGAQYTVKYYDSETATGTPERTWVFKTDNNGRLLLRGSAPYFVSGDELYMQDGMPTIPIGTITIQETLAPTGYLLNDELYTVYFKEVNGIVGPYFADGSSASMVTTDNEPGIDIQAEEDVMEYGIAVTKKDADRNASSAQGGASLAGIRYAVVNRSDNAVTYNDTSYAVGTVVSILTISSSGTASTAAIPYGLYDVQELRSDATIAAGETYEGSTKLGTSIYANNAGYLFEDQREPVMTTGGYGMTYLVEFSDEIAKGGVKIKKADSGLEASEAQGHATLEGAEITIYNSSTADVYVNDTWYANGEAVAVLTTDANGECQTAEDLLPYGTYTARETKAPEGYNLNTAWSAVFNISEDGQMLEFTAGDTGWLEEDVIRADLIINKTDGNGAPMGGVAFRISLLDKSGNVVESHIAVTDAGGMIDTKALLIANPDTSARNTLDAYASGYSYTGPTVPAPIYFGEGTGRGALVYGRYRIEELSCEANKGMDLLEGLLIADTDTVSAVFTEGRTFSTDFVNREIETESDLLDDATASKTASIGSSVTVTDTVKFSNLTAGSQYKVKTTLVHKGRTGDSRELGSKETTFTASAATATVDVKLTINTASAPGGTINAVDDLYLIKDGNEIFLMSHNEDLSEPRQSIVLSGISTQAVNMATGDQSGTSVGEQKVYDTLTYEFFPDDTSFIIESDLCDASTGAVVKDASGNICTGTTYLTVNWALPDGTVNKTGDDYMGAASADIDLTEFTLNGKDYEGKTLVFTATVKYAATGEVYMQVSDLTDANEMLTFPKIRTNASDSSTGSSVGNITPGTVTIKDEVSYTNLIPGKTYSISGTLMDKATGEALTYNGNTYTATTGNFTPEEANGTVSLTFTVPKAALEGGKTVVVFEDLMKDGKEVAVHADLTDEEQTVWYPDVKTSAKNTETGTHTGSVKENAKITDSVALKGLKVGETYTVKGILMDKATGESLKVGGSEVTAETTFEATAESMIVDMDYTFDATDLDNTDLVVFEDLYYGTVRIAVHNEIEDKDQTIYFPEGHTNAADGQTNDHVGTVTSEATITDRVTYKNLVIGESYTITGTLHYKEDFTDANGTAHKAGDAVLNASGNAVTESVTFTAGAEEGYTDLTFTLDSTLLEGTSVVAFESFKQGSVEVYAHSDLTDEDQTVHYPKVRTSAKDKDTGISNTSALGEVTIVDTVTYTNLISDGSTSYTIKGILMDKATGEEFKVGGKTVTAEKTFTPEAANGTVEIEFTFDASGLDGETFVVFEDLYHNDVKVTSHADIEDEGQTILIPDIATQAIDKDTEDQVGHVDEAAVVVDTVAYANLIPGTQYKLTAVLMDKATGEKLLVDGKEVTGEKTFTAEEANGTVDVEISVDSSLLGGTTVVAFETLSYEGIDLAVHAEIEDDDQSVYYPEVKTAAVSIETGDSVGSILEKETLIDTVSYKNLIPGKEYTVKGVLMDQTTGEKLLVDGKEVTAEQTFTPERADGTVEMTFELDSTTLEQVSTVVFEDLYHNDIKVASHADIEDTDQTVNFPHIHTLANDGQTEDEVGTVSETATIVDTVAYINLTKDVEYTVKGVLMDQATGEKLLVDGKEVTAETTFTAETSSGTVDVIFTFPSTLIAGSTTVVFEDLYHNDAKVTSHADIEDDSQTIHYPEIHTNAVDEKTEDHVGTVEKEAVIIDTVSYSNLVLEKEYTIKGILMDKATGEPLKGADGKEITAETTFTAEKADGTVDLTYKLDSSLLAGKTVVVFEDLYHNDVNVASHADIEDEDQSVHYPDIHTNATTAGAKEATISTTAVVTDVVSFTNLIPGKEYTLKGILMDKTTGKALLVGGKEVTSEVKFTPSVASGSIAMSFSFDSSALANKSTVVFEDLYHNDIKVTSHADINDVDQTVTFRNPPEVPKHPDTGDANDLLATGLAGLTAAIALVAVILYKRRRDRAQ